MVMTAKEIQDSMNECEVLSEKIYHVWMESDARRHGLYQERNTRKITQEEEQLINAMAKHEDILKSELNHLKALHAAYKIVLEKR